MVLRRSGVVLGLFVFVVAGCQGENKLYNVSGTVTYEGKPIPKGLIFFDPDSTKGTIGTQGFANITEGKYDTADHGKGIRGGSYVLRISGFDGKEANEAPFGQALFPEYQEKRDLPKENSKLDLQVPGKKKSG
ncbi:MAG TPA: hypothetical protein VFA18_04440 [Gemmataceae bacterium]|nr:hypothetical protein [Gemmataceae bacterium]